MWPLSFLLQQLCPSSVMSPTITDSLSGTISQNESLSVMVFYQSNKTITNTHPNIYFQGTAPSHNFLLSPTSWKLHHVLLVTQGGDQTWGFNTWVSGYTRVPMHRSPSSDFWWKLLELFSALTPGSLVTSRKLRWSLLFQQSNLVPCLFHSDLRWYILFSQKVLLIFSKQKDYLTNPPCLRREKLRN